MLTRPPFDAPLLKLKSTISASLQQELAKQKENQNASVETKSPQIIGGIQIGARCKNGGCKEVVCCQCHWSMENIYTLFFLQTYVDQSSNDTNCVFHPGAPIFHEGLKYWTCCCRRTTDFQAFLNQEGCTTGSHAWRNDEVS